MSDLEKEIAALRERILELEKRVQVRDLGVNPTEWLPVPFYPVYYPPPWYVVTTSTNAAEPEAK